MGFFESIMSKIFGRESDPAVATTPPTGGKPGGIVTKGAKPSATADAAASATAPVDVEAVLADLAAKKGGGGNWRTSIVDLMKLLDLDSSLAARKSLAQELGVNAGAHGSAEQNIALQKAVMRKLADNGGTVPASLRD